MTINRRLQQIRQMIFNPRCADCLIHRGLNDGQGMCQACEDRAIQIFWWGARVAQSHATIKQKHDGELNGQEGHEITGSEGGGEIIPVQVYQYQVPANPAQIKAAKDFPAY